MGAQVALSRSHTHLDADAGCNILFLMLLFRLCSAAFESPAPTYFPPFDLKRCLPTCTAFFVRVRNERRGEGESAASRGPLHPRIFTSKYTNRRQFREVRNSFGLCAFFYDRISLASAFSHVELSLPHNATRRAELLDGFLLQKINGQGFEIVMM